MKNDAALRARLRERREELDRRTSKRFRQEDVAARLTDLAYTWGAKKTTDRPKPPNWIGRMEDGKTPLPTLIAFEMARDYGMELVVDLVPPGQESVFELARDPDALRVARAIAQITDESLRDALLAITEGLPAALRDDPDSVDIELLRTLARAFDRRRGAAP